MAPAKASSQLSAVVGLVALGLIGEIEA